MQGIAHWIASCSIKTKMLAGFACVLVILLAVAGIGYGRFLGVAGSLHEYVQRARVVKISRDIDREFAEMRRHVREFALAGEPDEATAAAATADQVKLSIANGLAIIKDAERLRRMREITAQFDNYRRGVDTAFAMKREKDKLISDILDPTGTAARTDFDTLITSAAHEKNTELANLARDAQQALMLLRLNADKVIDRRRDDTAAKKADTAAADLTRLIGMLAGADAAAGDHATLDTLHQNVSTYMTAYHRAIQLNADLEQSINGSMKHDAELIAAAATAVASSAATDQQDIENATFSEISGTETVLLLFAAGGLVLGLAAAWTIGGGISRPVLRITEVMHRLASGELEIDVPAINRRDEVGRIAQALLVFRQNAQEARRLQGEAERVRAAKDRRQTAMDQCTQDFGTSASGVMATLVSAADVMRKTADEMTAAAHQTRGTASQTAEGAAASAQNLGAVAAAAEEMSASIHEISQQVARATQAAQDAVERASVTDAKVGSMAAAAERVGDVVRLISDIAGQTNLLALNATIEAARAGEAGKGFAVVAGEVKALAAQTAKATEEIATQIGAIRGVTSEAVNAVHEVSAAIGQVSEVAAAIAAAVEEQTATTREIAANAQSVMGQAQAATSAMQEVSLVSETTEAASQSVKQNADEVGRTADVLRSELSLFLEAMAKTDEEDRRRYERIDGSGATAMLRVPGRDAMRVTIANVSRGGVALLTDWWTNAGTEVQVELPGAGAAVVARTVRSQGGALALAFRQDEMMLRRIDAVLDNIASQATGRAAA